MGHKGVSKRKPKKNKSSVGASTASDMRLGESPSVQMLVKDKSALPNRGDASPHPGSNKKSRKSK